MPVGKKKSTTVEGRPSTLPATNPLPDQTEFARHLKDLARGAVRTVIEAAMREELTLVVGVQWGEHQTF